MSESTHANGGENPQGSSAPEALTIEAVNKLVNSAITGHLKREAEKQTAAFSKLIEEHVGKLVEQLKPAPKPDDKPGDSPELNALKKQLEESTRIQKQIIAERDAERLAARNLKLRTTVTDQLVAAGVDPSRAKHALAYLVDGEKRVDFDGDAIVFKDDSSGALPLAEGLKSWVKSPEAKLYLPPAGGGGTGQGQGQSGQAGNQGPSAGAALLAFAAGSFQQ